MQWTDTCNISSKLSLRIEKNTMYLAVLTLREFSVVGTLSR